MLDRLGILPRWKFFIPQAGRFDIAIRLRSGSDEAGLGDWSPLRLYPPGQAFAWLWFPEQHRASILLISAHRVIARTLRGDAAVAGSLAYQTLVRHIRQSTDTPDGSAFQFALIEPSSDGASDRTLFTSQVHQR